MLNYEGVQGGGGQESGKKWLQNFNYVIHKLLSN